MGLFAKTWRLPSRISLRLKLTLWMIAISLALQCTPALVVLLYQRSSFEQLLRARVLARADIVKDNVLRRDFVVTDEDLTRIVSELIPLEGDSFVIGLYRADGSVVASSRRPALSPERGGFARAKLGAAPVVVREVRPGPGDVGPSSPSSRLVLLPLRDAGGQSFTLCVGIIDAAYDHMTRLTSQIVLITVLVGIGAATIASWMIAGLATAPLHELRRLAGSFSPESIEQDIEMLPSSLSSQELAGLRRELEDARSRLREALHAQERFISSVSHELKTPIAVLLTEAQTLDTQRLPDEPRRFVHSVTEEMRRLGRMVESFLTLTKVRGGMKLVNTQRCAVNDIVVDAVQSCSKMARQYGVTLSLELADVFPPPNVTGDAELLRVMVDNLIHNAIRFSREGQRVVIGVAPKDEQCEVRVRDFGPGVPEDMKERLFDRFVQAPEEAGKGRGHGLGLSIAQGIAELHGGRISVDNVPDGGGCEFTVSLPPALNPRTPTDSSLREPEASAARRPA